PALAHPAQRGHRIVGAPGKDLFTGVLDVVDVFDLAHGQFAAQEMFDLVQQAQLVAGGQFDVDPFDGVGVFAHPVQRDDDVFVDLERVGVARDGRGAGAIQPEFLACFGRHSHEAFAVAAVGDAYHFAGGDGHCVLVVAHD